MATTTYVEYTGNGVNGKSFSFASYKEADVKVRVDKVLKTNPTHFTISNYTTTGGGQIDFTSGNIPGSGNILIYRDTEVDSPKADYQVGASLKAADLDNNQTQCLYALQEEQNQLVQTYHIKDDAIDGTKIADESIDSEHYVDGSIDSAHIANDQIDSQHYAAGSIDLEHMSANSIGEHQYVDASIKTAHIADDQIDSQHYAADSIDAEHYAPGSVDGTAIANDAIDSQHYAADSIDTEHYAPGSVDATAIATGALDGRYFTETESDARYYQISSSDDIQSTEAWAVSDTKVPTTKAVDARVITLVDEVGGFVPITNESDFPATNPDINSAAGTIVSIGVLSTSYTSSGSGVITIPASTLDNLSNDLTITGAANSTTYGPNFGMLVETKALSDAAYAAAPSYTFHRLLPKASEVTTLAGKATEIGRLGTAAAVEDMSILGTADCVADMAILGTADCVADMAILGTADVVADLNTLATADVVADLNTLATSDIVADMDAIAPKIADVETVADNIAAVENFADLYQIDDFSPSAPTTDGGGNAVAEGDLAYDSTANRLKVYTGSAWEVGVEAPSTLMPKAGGTFTGDVTFDNGTNAGKDMFWDESDDTLKLNDDVQLSLGSDRDMRLYHTGTHGYLNVVTGDLNIRTNGTESGIIVKPNAGIELYFDDSQKLTTTTAGIDVTGTVTTDGASHAGDVIFQGDGANSYWDKSNDSLIFNDNAGVNLGTGRDVRFYHDGSHAYMNVVTGDLNIRTNGTESAIICTKDAGVATYYNGNKKTETTNTGIDITGNIVVSGTVDGIDIATDVAANTAKVTNATHTGEVTGATALTIASDVIDEDNLKVDVSPTDDYVLTAKSSAAGGLTWAAAASGTPEGEAVLSTTNSNEASTKFLRADGDGTCSWQIPPDTTTPANDSVTAAKTDISIVAGDIIYGNGTDSWTRLAKGTAAQVLKMNSGATAPEWGAASSGTITALNNQQADRLTTIGATTTELDGEANLTFNDAATTGLISARQVTGRGFECPATVSDDWTIAAGNNAMFPGPMTVAASKTVTVPANRTLTIV